ncbi:integral membrane protein [Colletotrichum sojae]|uniref:Integral membrane protein n=1 Tax=Colletotrichum sojae TaxID=2175907 RepID=A0A8H6ML02_9PEZI|nr:integral membrane protein [Colletotrichum sojae]
MKSTLMQLAAGVLLFASGSFATTNPYTGNSTAASILLAKTPSCALPCFIDGFHAGQCSMTNLTDCVCTNVPLQAGVSQCVQTSCEFSDQYGTDLGSASFSSWHRDSTRLLTSNVDTALVSQELCRGYPTQSRRRYSRVFSIALPTISATIVGLRCWARYTVTQKLWWDDWSALVALVSQPRPTSLGPALGASALTIAVLSFRNVRVWFCKRRYGLWGALLGRRAGQREDDPSVTAPDSRSIVNIVKADKRDRVAAKTSICCFYYRVFPVTHFLLAVKGALVFIIVHGAMFLFLVMFQCLPVQSIWDRSIEGKCLSITAIGYGGAALSIFEDIVLFIMPVPELLKLQLSTKKKWALVFMFGVGCFACIASMIRLKYLVSLAHTFDATWDNVDVAIWSSIEVNLAIMCGSLPALRPVFKKVPALFSTALGTARSGTNRRSGAPTPSAKASNHSRPSCATSAESSPRRPILAEAQRTGFGSASTVKVSHSAAKERLDFDEGVGSRDDLERQDWAAEKPAS